MNNCKIGSSPPPVEATHSKDNKMTTTPPKPELHIAKCTTCNKNDATWDIYSKIAKKGEVVNVQLECTGCGDLMPMSATLTNLRNTFGLKKVTELIGAKP